MLDVEKIIFDDGSKMLTVKVPREVGICAKEISIFIDKNDNIDDLVVVGGCAGNLSAVATLINGMNINQVVDKLKDITCGKKNTSCPNEIANILRDFRNE